MKRPQGRLKQYLLMEREIRALTQRGRDIPDDVINFVEAMVAGCKHCRVYLDLPEEGEIKERFKSTWERRLLRKDTIREPGNVVSS